MIEGFMKSVQNLLNVDLHQVDSSLPKYIQEREEVLKVAEENAVHKIDQAENPVPNERDISPQKKGSVGNKLPIPKTGFQGRIRKWIKSVLSYFKPS